VIPFTQWQAMEHATKISLKSLLLHSDSERVDVIIPARNALVLRKPKAL
jgi:hypothetical protein